MSSDEPVIDDVVITNANLFNHFTWFFMDEDEKRELTERIRREQ